MILVIIFGVVWKTRVHKPDGLTVTYVSNIFKLLDWQESDFGFDKSMALHYFCIAVVNVILVTFY